MQRGEIRKNHGAWYVRFYEGKKRRSVRLGSLQEFPTKRAIQPVVDEMIRRFQIAASVEAASSTNLSNIGTCQRGEFSRDAIPG